MEEVIRVNVKFYAGLERYTSEKLEQQQMLIKKGSSLLTLLELLGLPRTMATIVFTNEEILPLHAVIPDGASIKIFPPIAGG